MKKLDYVQPAEELAEGQYEWQQYGGKDKWWKGDKADLLERLTGQRPPAFRTVLAVRETDAEGKPTRLAGNLYFDLDGDLASTCEDFRALIAKIEALGANLSACRLAATGGRGFHLETPYRCFIPSMPGNGIADLHLIYRAMATALQVPTMDLAIYSCKRQWRTFGVKRENSRYKVPLTPAEALAITPESYLDLCSSPRPFPALTPPCLSAEMMALFHRCRDQKTQTARKQAKTTEGAALLMDRCQKVGAPLPPSLLALCFGQIKPREGVGFNKLALQLAIAGHAFNIEVDDLLKIADPLIQSHESDGRYNTVDKRRQAVKELYGYSKGYSLSVGGLRSILPQDFSANDLRGL